MNGAEGVKINSKRTIDFIYIRGNSPKYKVLTNKVLANRYKVGDELLYPSDHCPVEATIRLTK